jgi:hypothetical protein
VVRMVVLRRIVGIPMASTVLPVGGDERGDRLWQQWTRVSKQEAKETYAPIVLPQARARNFVNAL